MKRRITRALAAAVLVGLINSSTWGGLINGGFEAPSNPPPPGDDVEIAPGQETTVGFCGWTVESGTVDVVEPPAPLFGMNWGSESSIDGLQVLDLAGLGNGTISQVISTMPGQGYTLSFWYSNNPLDTVPETAQITVTNVHTGATLLSQSISHDNATLTQPNWVSFSQPFVATSTLTRLRFASTTSISGASNGVILDAVNVIGLSGPVGRGDMNCDGLVDLLDVDPFVQALLDPSAYVATHLCCRLDAADINADGVEDGLDIELFTNCLLDGQCQGMPSDLVAGYAFDDGVGATATDASGHGLTGTLINGPAWAPGMYGGALNFDGVNDFVDLNDPPALRITESMTVSAWINSSSFPPDDAAIVSRRSGGQIGFQLDTTIDQGPRGIGFKLTSSSGTNMMRYGATAMQSNTWYHVAGVYDSAAATMKVYLNGALDNGGLVGTITSSQQNSTEHVNIGRRPGNSGFEFAGRIDDVRIYNRALTPQEILADMMTPLGTGNPSDPNPPTVSITFPTAGASVNEIVTITADASDDVGVVGVRMFVDGTLIGVEDLDAPYAADWDTRSVSNGLHTLTALARDAAGNVTISPGVPVNVSNTNYFQNEILATGFDLPTTIEFLPDGRLLVGELAGVIKILPPPYTQPDPTPFLQIANIGSAGVQQGIYDIALDPNFAINRFYYVFYTAGSPNHDRLSRFTANSAFDGTIPGSELILYEDSQGANAEHHGGAVNFGNDGKVYFTTGEHFNPPDAQNLSSPRGKLHRINSDGTIPIDNPFHDGAGPNVDSIWALGLRNPFRACFDAPTNRLLIADVGGNDYSTAQEEVNLGASGANYGWPNCELGNCGNPAYSPAIYAYAHNGRDASITGGFVYHGSQFPSAYQGSYFFADYTQNWIRRLTFDANGDVSGVFNFEPPDGSVDGPYGDIVYLAEGPDGALYYVDLGYSDIGGSFGISKLRRIRYVQSNLPPISVANANPTQGPAPLTVDFSSAGSSDPEGLPITYAWTFGDSETSSEANPTHIYAQAGQYQVRLTVSDGVNSTLSTPLAIQVGIPPVATIIAPQDGAFFFAGDVINFSGNASDADDGPLSAAAFRWNIDFLHEGHVHPGTPINGVTGGSFAIPTSGHDFSGNTRFRITLTVTDSDGLTDVKQSIIWPTKVNLAFDSIPSGLTLYLDGVATLTPFVHDALVNFNHSIEARNQSNATTIYTFASWSDGGAQTHTINVPATAQNYTATYDATPNTTPFTIGETTVFGGNDSGNGNLLLVQDATLIQPGTLQTLSFHVNLASGDLRLGLYGADGPGGGPGTLKAQTNSFAPVVGWNTANVIAPVSLSPGDYWLAYLPSSSGLSFATNFSIGSYRYANLTFGPMPSVFPAIAGQGATHWSLYGTLTPP